MRSLTMTTEQTAIYDRDDAASAELMRELIAQAQVQAEKTGETVEIYTADGIVAEAVTPDAERQ